MIEQGHHFVFKFNAPVHVFQGAEAVEIECGTTRSSQRSDVAARALDPHHVYLLTGERVFVFYFHRGVSAPVVGQPEVGSEQVGAVNE
ncbi:hypothetical protein D9M69_687600 [compost metagenome]